MEHEKLFRKYEEGDSMSQKRMYYESLMEQLDVLSMFKDDWNGYGCKAPNKASVSNARTILHAGFTEDVLPTAVAASTEEGIGLTYSLKGKILYIECLNANKILFYCYNDETEPITWNTIRGIGSAKKEFRKAIDIISAW